MPMNRAWGAVASRAVAIVTCLALGGACAGRGASAQTASSEERSSAQRDAATTSTGAASTDGGAAALPLMGTTAGCPPVEPVELAACPQSQLRCTYGVAPECAKLFDCYLGEWRLRSRSACHPDHRGACPPVPSTAQPSIKRVGDLSCTYADGTVCGLRYEEFHPPCSGVAWTVPPRKAAWQCRQASRSPCELVRPAHGGRCEPEGATCGTTCCGQSSRCVNGRWEVRSHPCPPSTPR